MLFSTKNIPPPPTPHTFLHFIQIFNLKNNEDKNKIKYSQENKESK